MSLCKSEILVTGLIKDLRNADLDEMIGLTAGMNQPRFRGIQLFKWIHQRGVCSFTDMTDLPMEFRERLQQEYKIEVPQIETKRESALDGTIKLLLRFSDNLMAESVIIPHEDGSEKCTVCVSSQIGCAIGCSFCATGTMGFTRNLTVSEILGQVYLANEIGRSNRQRRYVSNVVFMGMGEPFLNYDAVLKSIRILIDPNGINIGQRKIVVSTSGCIPGILKLADEGLQVVLAVSLHSASNQLRDRLVPLNRKYPLEKLAEACLYYNEKTGKRITFEYALIEGINDSPGDALQLAKYVRPLSANVNIIPLNEVSHGNLRRSSKSKIIQFMKVLSENGIECVIRKERGSDIAGACGQLCSDSTRK